MQCPPPLARGVQSHACARICVVRLWSSLFHSPLPLPLHSLLLLTHCINWHLSGMDERISLTRHVAARMLDTKPWRSLLHSTSTRSVAAQRLYNILTLFPELLRDRKRRDQLYSLVDSIGSLLTPLSPTRPADVTATELSSTSSLVFQLYVAALADRLLRLLPYFTSSQQLHVIERLQSHVERSSPLPSLSLALLRTAFLSQQPFAHLHLAPHHLTFASSQQLKSTLHTSCTDPLLSASPSTSSSPSPIHLLLSHLPRLPCPSCSTAQRFYCVRCYCVVHSLAARVVPRVSLPFQLHIVLHPRFDRSKSTALHCQLLCPSADVQVYEWPRVPQWDDAATYVMWPEEQAVEVPELAAERLFATATTDCSVPPTSAPRRAVVLLEGTWEQASEMRRSTRLARLPSIRLSHARTSFWRWQDNGAAHLSSIEAVYHTAVQWPRAQHVQLSDDFDNLLWLFALGWTRVRDYYAQHPQLLPPVSHSGYQAAPVTVE